MAMTPFLTTVLHTLRENAAIVFLIASMASIANAQGAFPPIPIAEGLDAPSAEVVEPGYVYSKDGDLYRDGKRIKFWGVNCVSEFWREKEDQLRILDRLEALGFNAIRIHLIDNTIVDPEGPGYTISGYQRGDNTKMDKFDHFLSEAYKRGIVVWMTLDRRRVSFKPEAYDICPPKEDEEEWKSAMQVFAEMPSSPAYQLEKLWPINPRLESVFTRYVENVMKHRNAYTGHIYAEEPGIALWEIANEGGAVYTILNGELFESLKDYPYWKNTAEQLWNEFLREHYGDDQTLIRAWGELKPGESLAAGTVKFEPIPPGKAKEFNRKEFGYPSRRIGDLITFVTNRFVESNNRVWQVMRDSAPQGRGAAVVPVVFDTHYLPALHNLYGVSQGSFVSVGAYTWVRTYDESDPLYPLKSSLSHKPSYYGMDMGNVADKPMVTYEFNIHKPAPYRAEIPYLMAAYISSNHWDGFFWYHWMTSGQPTPRDNAELLEQPIHYARTVNFWGGVVISSDEVLVSAIRMAGEMFKSDAIRGAANPMRFVIDHGQFVDPNLTTRSRYAPMKVAGWTRGMNIEFRPNRKGGSTVSKALVSWPETQGKFRLGYDATLDNAKRQLVIDSKTAHAFVGWPDTPVVAFSSGLKISGYPLGRFMAFSVVSEDGLPVAQSNRLLVSVQGTAQNTGYKYDPLASKDDGFTGLRQGMVDIGVAPVIVNRPRLTVEFPNGRRGVAHLYNIFPEEFAKQDVKGQFVFDGTEPIAWVEIHFE